MKNIELLRKFKNQYRLTWPQVAEALGRSLREIECWAGGTRNIPTPYKILLEIFIDHPQIFKKFRLTKTKNF